MGGLTPIGAIGLGSSFLEYSNYIPTQARAHFHADVPGLEVHGMMLRLSTSTYPHGLPAAHLFNFANDVANLQLAHDCPRGATPSHVAATS